MDTAIQFFAAILYSTYSQCEKIACIKAELALQQFSSTKKGASGWCKRSQLFHWQCGVFTCIPERDRYWKLLCGSCRQDKKNLVGLVRYGSSHSSSDGSWLGFWIISLIVLMLADWKIFTWYQLRRKCRPSRPCAREHCGRQSPCILLHSYQIFCSIGSTGVADYIWKKILLEPDV